MSFLRKAALAAATLAALVLPAAAQADAPRVLWTSAEVAAAPTSGPAWTRLLSAANLAPASMGIASLQEIGTSHDVNTLAKAIVAVRLNDATRKAAATTEIRRVIGTEDDQGTNGARTLNLCRNGGAYIVAADLLGLHQDTQIKTWAASLMDLVLKDVGSTNDTTPRILVFGGTPPGRSAQLPDATNWASSCLWLKATIDRFLNDSAGLAATAANFQARMGEGVQSQNFRWLADGTLNWMPTSPAGRWVVLPAGSTKSGHDIGGSLPAEMARQSSSFVWPPPSGTDYPWASFHHLVLTAEVLQRAGFPAYTYGSSAIQRAAKFLDRMGGEAGWAWPLHSSYRGVLPILKVRFPGAQRVGGAAFWDGLKVSAGMSMTFTDWGPWGLSSN